MTATCTHCDSTFHHCDRNEDGSPFIETTRCAHPGCEVYLCRAGCEHLSFSCDGCGGRFCLGHLVEVPDGTDHPLKCCPSCAAECEPVEIPRRPPVMARPAVALEVA